MKLLKTIFFLLILTGITFSQTTYVWTGSVNSIFSTAGNWSPVRQVGLTSDKLVFENGGALNVTGVNQVTIGQLIIRNNTNLTLSPSTGNSKTISIKGGTGEDLDIATGSSLKISGNDPQLNIYFLAGATASVNGSLTFQGTIAHNINAVNENAIRFKNGSVLTQSCPGSMFNNTGIKDAVVFESGSEFIINNQNALSPFGISAPNSKVIFENGSSLKLMNIGSFTLNGRTVSNLIIEQGSMNISEQFTSDVTVGSIVVKSGASLNIANTNQTISKFNVHGNISVEGSLTFNSQSINALNVILDGSQPQVISGSGEISIPKSLNKFTISNDIVLQRDITVYCNLRYLSGNINYNGFNIISSRKRITLDQEETMQTANTTENRVVNSTVPSEYSISQNYPNPFNPSTKINYSLPQASKVTIKIFDITGKEVAQLVNTDQAAGYHTADFNAGSLSSGVYFYTINAGGYNKTLKMILTK